ncbi:ABC-F family ATP-binding cassette domain-containing protein [Candidatus Parcubacteria bacterium]|nr:ABC-F family ATP-binding cassette domain-containing protein [Candidatus Parcubacteria bacterium]
MLITNNLSIKLSSQEILKDINISLDSSSRKKVALVGKNGCGKSSLLKVLNREINPSSGNLDMANENIAYLPQDIDFPGYSLVGEFLESKLDEPWTDYKIDIAMGDVGLDEEYLLKNLKNLSGGEKVKVALAGLLMAEPTILLLDEPTNNLDINGVEWLEKFILNFNGSIIVVSHDRHLINMVVNEVWEIDLNTLGIIVYGGNYDKFLEEKNRIYNRRITEYNYEEREIKKIEKWLKAHEFHPKYRFSAIVGDQKEKLARLKAKMKDKPIGNTKIKINNLGKEKRGLVLSVNIKSKKFSEKEIIKDLSFKIYKGERVLLKGANGSGKTTLLNIISKEDEDFNGELVIGEEVKIGYLKQFSSLNKKNSILDEFENETGIIEPKSRSILASYSFDQENVIRKVSTLSYGQLKRLELAIILAREPSLLILDEPTNHLDIYTREELESFVISQKVPMIIVSHDRYFIKKIGVDKEIKLN